MSRSNEAQRRTEKAIILDAVLEYSMLVQKLGGSPLERIQREAADILAYFDEEGQIAFDVEEGFVPLSEEY